MVPFPGTRGSRSPTSAMTLLPVDREASSKSFNNSKSSFYLPYGESFFSSQRDEDEVDARDETSSQRTQNSFNFIEIRQDVLDSHYPTSSYSSCRDNKSYPSIDSQSSTLATLSKHKKPKKAEDSPMNVVYFIGFVSWIAALALMCRTNASIYKMELQTETYQTQAAQHERELTDLRQQIMLSRTHVQKLMKTSSALDHEIHILQGIDENDRSVPQLPPSMSEKGKHELITDWLDHRKQGLTNRVKQLQIYLQAYSRQQVVEKFGPGPHHLRFTVEFQSETKGGDATLRSFVLELASLDEMPHSVHFFLDMVQLKMWDHTFFLHHEDVEHVIAGVPIDFRSQHLKSHHLSYLGWSGLGFPEYSPNWPHKEYTIGFANRGPTFYFNTIDNTKAHGPKGQGHHLMDEDGDPCFGRVVEGQNVVDELIQYGLNSIGNQKDNNHVWAGEEHAWTHIVSVEII